MNKLNIELQAKLKEDGYDFNNDEISAYWSDCVRLLKENKNKCLNCPGLSSCRNSTPGLYFEYENKEFRLKSCKYKKEQVKLNKEMNQNKPFYMVKFNGKAKTFEDIQNAKQFYNYCKDKEFSKVSLYKFEKVKIEE